MIRRAEPLAIAALICALAVGVVALARRQASTMQPLGKFASYAEVVRCVRVRDIPRIQAGGYRVSLDAALGVERPSERTVILKASPDRLRKREPFVAYLIYEDSVNRAVQADDDYARFAGGRMLEGAAGNWFVAATSDAARQAVLELQNGCVARLTCTTDADFAAVSKVRQPTIVARKRRIEGNGRSNQRRCRGVLPQV